MIGERERIDDYDYSIIESDREILGDEFDQAVSISYNTYGEYIYEFKDGTFSRYWPFEFGEHQKMFSFIHGKPNPEFFTCLKDKK